MAAVKFRVPNGLQADDDLLVGTDLLFADVSADHVGIGTASPGAALDVVSGTARVQVDDSSDWMVVGNGTVAGGLSLRGNLPGEIGSPGAVLLYGSSHATNANELALQGVGVVSVRLSASAVTFLRPVATMAATTSYPSLNVPAGTAPSAPTSGDLWNESGTLKFRNAGGTTETIAELTNKVTDFAAPTSDFSMAGYKITSLATPTASTDAATKGYVDNVAAGLDPKGSVRAVSTSNITLSGAQTIDGVAVIAGDRVLVAGQSTTANNGIYVCAAGAWSRATDADASDEVTSGMYVWVEEGTSYADTGWVLTTNNPITLDTTGLTFTQFSGLGQVTAGAGLTKSGNTLAVGAGTGITVNADDVALTIPVAVTSGGTGQSSALTQYGIVYGSSTTAMATTAAPGSALKALVGSATAPTWTAAGSAYQSLTINSGATAIAWGAVDLSQSAAVTGTLPTTRGGTGLTSFTSGGVMYASSTSALATTALAAATQALIGGAAPAWTAAGSANQVLRINSGGTAAAFGAIDLTAAAAVTGALTVANGGTGAATFTQYGVLYGNGTGAVQVTAAPASALKALVGTATAPAWTSAATAGQVLRADSPATAVAFGSLDLSLSGTVGSSVLSAANGGTGRSTLTAYAVLVGNGTGQVGMIGPGATGYVLVGQTATNPTWTNQLAIFDVTLDSTGSVKFKYPDAESHLEGVFSQSTTSVSQYTLYSWAVADYNALTVHVYGEQGTNVMKTTLDIVTDGTTVSWTESAQVVANTAPLSLTLDVSGGSVRLLVTPASASTTIARCRFSAFPT